MSREPKEPTAALRRELVALVIVYLALSILPLLSGFACHG